MNARSSPLCIFPLASISFHAFAPFFRGSLLFFKSWTWQVHATCPCNLRACNRYSVSIQPVKKPVCTSNPSSSLIPPGLFCSSPGLHTFLSHLSTPCFFSKKNSTILQLPGQRLGVRSSLWFPTHAPRSHDLVSPLTPLPDLIAFDQTLVAHHGDSWSSSLTF